MSALDGITNAAVALLLLAVAGCAATREVMPNENRQSAPLRPERVAAADAVTPTPPASQVRLRFTLPDSVEWRRPGWSHYDSTARAHSDMRAEVYWVARWPAPWPPVAYRESLLCVTGWRFHGSAVDTTIQTPGHGVVFVRARNAAGAWPIPSNLAAARVSE